MRSNYKKLGPYIREVNIRNVQGNEENLLGVSTQKIFIKSISNTIGTDFTTYKIVKKNQFTYIADTSRRGDKIAIALLTSKGEAMVSQAYTVFETIDNNELDPEYLMMWFRRPEFDRYARFKSHGSAREIFDWNELCDIELPIPSIEAQREIVKEYHTITNRIKLNERLNQKLEETAHALYKQWFVDFEFPDEKGKPYKSNGGKMVWNDKLQLEIPTGWNHKVIKDLVDCNYSVLSFKDNFKSIEYLDTSNITNNSIGEIQELNLIFDEIPSRARRKVTHKDIIFSTVRPNLRHFGILINPKPNMIVSTGFAVLKSTYPNLCSELIYLLITNEENLQSLQARAEMSVSTYPSINPEDILNIPFTLANEDILLKAALIFVPLYDLLDKLGKENWLLRLTRDLLLQRLSVTEQLLHEVH